MVEAPQTVIVIGGSGGIGRSLVKELLRSFPSATVFATFCRSAVPFQHKRVQWHQLDIRDPVQIHAWASTFEQVDWLINCALAIRWTQGRTEVIPGRISFFGTSQGGGGSLTL